MVTARNHTKVGRQVHKGRPMSLWQLSEVKIGLNGTFHPWGNEVRSGAVSQEISKILIVQLSFVTMGSTAVPREVSESTTL